MPWMQLILIGYMFLFIHRPFEVWPVLGDLHVERIYALGAMLAVAVYPGKRWMPNPQHGAHIGFALVTLFCWVASPFAAHAQEAVENYFKIVIFYFLLVTVIHDEDGLRRMVLAFLGIMFVYMAHSLREYIGGRYTFRMGIPRLIGVDKSLGDPNSFAASVVYSLPFLAPFWLLKPSWKMRLFILGYLGLAFICIGLTGSRSGFIGLILWGALAVIKSRRRWLLSLGAVILAPAMWFALPPSLQNRFETIIHPEVGPANAIASGQDRIDGLKIGLELWGRSPLLGVGPGAWQPAARRKLESHNLYGQLLGEMGVVGAVAFIAVVAAFCVNLRAIRREYREHPQWNRDFLYYLTGAVGFALFLLLFEGNFGHNLFRYSWLWYGGFLIVARHCVKERLAGTVAYAPVRPRVATVPVRYGYAGF